MEKTCKCNNLHAIVCDADMTRWCTLKNESKHFPAPLINDTDSKELYQSYPLQENKAETK